MPEGDTIYRTAERVRAVLSCQTLTAVSGSSGSIRANSARLTGASVVDVRSIGKHVLVETDADLVIRTHMRMSGTWEVYKPGRRRHHPSAARAALDIVRSVAVCFRAGSRAVVFSPAPLLPGQGPGSKGLKWRL